MPIDRITEAQILAGLKLRVERICKTFHLFLVVLEQYLVEFVGELPTHPEAKAHTSTHSYELSSFETK